MTRLQPLSENAGQQFRRFCTNQSGATAVEYALIAVGIAVVIVAVVSSIGSSVKGAFTSTSNGLN